MTSKERDELLVRLEERMKGIDDKLAADYRHIHGNGHPGLIQRVQKLEDWHEASRHHWGSAAMALGLLVNTIGVLYAIFGK